MALRITDAQLAVLAAAGCGVQEEPVVLTLELRDEGGEPVAGERFEARLADGSVRRGTTDQQGTACLEAVPRGPCEVTFPLAATRVAGVADADAGADAGTRTTVGAGARHRYAAGATARLELEKVGRGTAPARDVEP